MFLRWLAGMLAGIPPVCAQSLYVGLFDGEIASVSETGVVKKVARLSTQHATLGGMAVDARGRLFVGLLDGQNDGTAPWQIVRVDTDGAFSTVATLDESTRVCALAVDDAGNFYVLSHAEAADGVHDVVLRIDATGERTVLATGAEALPRINDGGILRDAQGNVFFTQFGLGRVSKLTPAGTVSVVASGIPGPTRLALHPQGALFVAGEDGIYHVGPNGAVSRWVQCAYPGGLALDDRGNVFALLHGTNALWKITPDGAMMKVTAGLPDAVSLALASGGHNPWRPAMMALGAFVVATLMAMGHFVRRRRGREPLDK